MISRASCERQMEHSSRWTTAYRKCHTLYFYISCFVGLNTLIREIRVQFIWSIRRILL